MNEIDDLLDDSDYECPCGPKCNKCHPYGSETDTDSYKKVNARLAQTRIADKMYDE